MICPSIPIPASTEHTEFFLYISCRQKLPHPFAGARGHMALSLYPLEGRLDEVMVSYRTSIRH